MVLPWNVVVYCVADRGICQGVQAVHLLLQAGDAPAEPRNEQWPHQAHPHRG